MSFTSSFSNLRHGLFYSLITSRKYQTITLGDAWTWTIDPSEMSAQSVVYCAGVGDDISFEKQLVKRFGCEVTLLDPSPTGEITMSLPENQDTKLKYEKAGLADKDGEIVLGVPENPTAASYFMTADTQGGMRFPSKSLPSLMQKQGHNRIDLLKMDIEGFEYGILRQICAEKIPIRQICVEFHHSIVPGIARSETIKIILKLMRAGYRLIHRKDWDHTFVKR